MKRDYEKEYKKAADRMFAAREIESIRKFKMPDDTAACLMLQAFDGNGDPLIEVELSRKEFTVIRRILLKLKKRELGE